MVALDYPLCDYTCLCFLRFLCSADIFVSRADYAISAHYYKERIALDRLCTSTRGYDSGGLYIHATQRAHCYPNGATFLFNSYIFLYS
jgi:hypothetical protein